MTNPETLEEARTFRYGRWAGNERGNSYTEGLCVREVAREHSYLYGQCRRPMSKTNPPFCNVCARKIANRKK